MALVVQKYGGTSVASVERIRKVADRIILARQTHQRLVVVLSAMGNTTNKLKELAVQIDEKPAGREWDMLASTGEQVSIALLAMALRQKGCEAVSLTGWQAGITTQAKHMDARIQSIDPSQIHKHLDAGKVVIVAGYQGITEQGEITTLGRGGSDTSAVALAAALQAELCEILTDVDGIYTADPRLVPAAQKFSWISAEQMLLLARLGASVLHPRCVEEARKHQVPLVVSSSFTAEDGTRVGGVQPTGSVQPRLALAHREEPGGCRVSIVGETPLSTCELPPSLRRLPHSNYWKRDEEACLYTLVHPSAAKNVLRVVHTALGLDEEMIQTKAVTR